MLLGFSQTKPELTFSNQETENISIVIEVDTAEELEKTFKLDDAKELLESSDSNVSVTIICNGKKMSSGVKSSMSYKVTGNAANPDEFLQNVEKIRSAAIDYYNN